MKNADQIIEDITKRKNFRSYRASYGKLTFEDLRRINNAGFKRFGIQNYGHHEIFSMMFDALPQGVPLKVAELGCSQGHLAVTMLKRFPNIVSWVGYDISDVAIKQSVVEDSRYSGVALTDWFGSYKLPDFDVLVSSHTLEHLTYKQLEEMFLSPNLKPTWVFLEFPIILKWPQGDHSTHILSTTRKIFDALMGKAGYSKFHQADRKQFIERLKPDRFYGTGWVRK